MSPSFLTLAYSFWNVFVGEMNINRGPCKTVRKYALLEILGQGSFGSVYKAKKEGQQTVLAVKEVRFHQASAGLSVSLLKASFDAQP